MTGHRQKSTPLVISHQHNVCCLSHQIYKLNYLATGHRRRLVWASGNTRSLTTSVATLALCKEICPPTSMVRPLAEAAAIQGALVVLIFDFYLPLCISQSLLVHPFIRCAVLGYLFLFLFLPHRLFGLFF
jgi:hypothetical protein